ncbi:MAG: glycosyltransferase, partial [Clostridia bacterium]|nr:glycosyltransferase [Clostridia bacterium]
MKVLQINATYGIGSTGTIVRDIGNTLRESGNIPYFAYQSANCEVENGYKIGNILDWKWHALYTRIFGKQAYASKRTTKKFLKWLDKIKPDVVHLHNLHSNYINLNLLLDYLAKNKIKTVITLHDCWYFTGKCTHYVNDGCDKWQDRCGNCPKLKKEVKSYFFDVTEKVLNDKITKLNAIQDLTIVGCSKWIAEETKKSKIKPKEITVIHNGVDISIFKPHDSEYRKSKRIGDEFVVLGLADKWYDEKNRSQVELLINSHKDVKFVIIGVKKHNEEFFNKFDNVIAEGFIKDKNYLADIYSASDVFVNLTHADTLPTVNMESICSGTPVITFDACGSPELVDSQSGFVVKEGDFDGIEEKLNY